MSTIGEMTMLPAFRLGTAVITPSTREVLAPAGREVLEPKVMQVLVALAAARGEIVTRDQLVRDCWDGRAISEDAISRVIQRLRRLSESQAAGAFVIRTVHKVGYRLIECRDEQPVAPAAAVPAVPTDIVTDTVADIGRRAFLAPVAGLAATLVIAGGMQLLRGNPGNARVEALIAESGQALRSGTPEGDALAAGRLEQAVALQPDNAAAWGRLALARTYVAEAAPPASTAAAVAGAQDAARQALALDRAQPDALGALAILPPYFGDWLAAERRMAAVLARHPGHLPTRDGRDFLLSAVGRGREGSLDRIGMAAEDRLHTVYQSKLVYAHWLLGQVDEADRAADRALQLWPRHPAVWSARFYTFALTGRPERALAHVDDTEARPALPPPMIDALRATSVALASRRPADIGDATARLVAQAGRSPGQAVGAVAFLNGLGQIDRAFEVAHAYLLEEGPLMASVRWRAGEVSANDDRRRKTNMLFLPSSAPMRADPRFAILMKRTGLAEFWDRSGVQPDHLV